MGASAGFGAKAGCCNFMYYFKILIPSLATCVVVAMYF